MPDGVGKQLAIGAAIIGFVIAGLAAIALVQFVGWLAIGLIGLLVLLAAVRLELHGGHAVPDIHHSAKTVEILARQMQEEAKAATGAKKLALEAERLKRRRYHYIARTVGIALIAVGFGMFFLHQL